MIPSIVRILVLEALQTLEQYLADNAKALGAQFIDSVFARMPVGVRRAIIQVDQIESVDAAAQERHMVVFYGAAVFRKMTSEPQMLRRAPDQLTQRTRRVQILKNVELSVSDHIHIDQSADIAQGAVARPFFRQMPAAVQAVSIRPLCDGFFAVEPDQVDIVAPRLSGNGLG